MATDKVLLEVLNNRFTGIVEEMGYIIHRASFTVFVKETWDFDSALVTTAGEIFCYPRNIGVTNMLGMHMDDAIRCIPHYEPGDVIVTNDPHLDPAHEALPGGHAEPGAARPDPGQLPHPRAELGGHEGAGGGALGVRAPDGRRARAVR